jgi:hypothetical protein
MNKTIKKKKGYFIVKLGIRILLFLVLLFIGLTVYIYTHRDQLEEYIIEYVDQTQPGKLSLDKINFSPFANFPHISLNIENLSYYSTKTDFETLKEPMLTVETVILSFDLKELLNNKLSIKEIKMKNGSINYINVPDSLATEKSNEMIVTDSTSEAMNFDIDLQEFSIQNFRFNVADTNHHFKSSVVVDKLKLQFSHNNAGVDNLNLSIDLSLEEMQFGLRKFEFNKQISIKADAQLLENEKQITLNQAQLLYDDFLLNCSGNYDYGDRDSLFLAFEASDKNLTLFSLLIKNQLISEDLNVIKKGNIKLYGDIKGSLTKGVPMLNVNLVLDDFHIEIPGEDVAIKDLGFNLFCSTGGQPDFAKSVIELANLRGVLPGGGIEGFLRVDNFKSPIITSDLSLELDVQDLDRVFKIKNIDSLGGILKFKASVNQLNILENIDHLTENEIYQLELKDFRFKITGVTHLIDDLDASIKYDSGDYLLEKFHIQNRSNNINLTGEITNLEYLFFGKQKELSARIRIDADSVLISDIIPFQKDKGKFLERRITDIAIELNIKTDVFSIMNNYKFPSLEASIDLLEGKIEGLPKIEHTKIVARLEDDSVDLNIILYKGKIQTGSGSLDLQAEFILKPDRKSTIEANLAINDVELNRVINGLKKDFSSDVALPNEKLSCAIDLKGNMGFKPFELSSFNLSLSDLDYQLSDSVYYKISHLDVKLDDMLFNQLKINPDQPAIENLNGHIKIDDFNSHILNEGAFDIDISCRQDNFKIKTFTRDLFGADEFGEFSINLSNPIPAIVISYQVPSFEIKNLLATISEEKILEGEMAFNMNFTAEGKNPEELFKTATGALSLSGEDLELHGIDLDKVLAKVSRTQRFNIADIGAIMIVGPFGAMVTKGFDFAGLTKINLSEKDSTTIVKFLSEWELESGIFSAKDVAFSTEKQLLALKGNINVLKDSIEYFEIGIVDKKGCALISQDIYGKYDKIEMGKIKVVGTLFESVINVLELVAGTKCEPFYKGTVKHPKSKIK